MTWRRPGALRHLERRRPGRLRANGQRPRERYSVQRASISDALVVAARRLRPKKNVETGAGGRSPRRRGQAHGFGRERWWTARASSGLPCLDSMIARRSGNRLSSCSSVGMPAPLLRNGESLLGREAIPPHRPPPIRSAVRWPTAPVASVVQSSVAVVDDDRHAVSREVDVGSKPSLPRAMPFSNAASVFSRRELRPAAVGEHQTGARLEGVRSVHETSVKRRDVRYPYSSLRSCLLHRRHRERGLVRRRILACSVLRVDPHCERTGQVGRNDNSRRGAHRRNRTVSRRPAGCGRCREGRLRLGRLQSPRASSAASPCRPPGSE